MLKKCVKSALSDLKMFCCVLCIYELQVPETYLGTKSQKSNLYTLLGSISLQVIKRCLIILQEVVSGHSGWYSLVFVL